MNIFQGDKIEDLEDAKNPKQLRASGTVNGGQNPCRTKLDRSNPVALFTPRAQFFLCAFVLFLATKVLQNSGVTNSHITCFIEDYAV